MQRVSGIVFLLHVHEPTQSTQIFVYVTIVYISVESIPKSRYPGILNGSHIHNPSFLNSRNLHFKFCLIHNSRKALRLAKCRTLDLSHQPKTLKSTQILANLFIDRELARPRMKVI